jgi:hypothetical protein
MKKLKRVLKYIAVVILCMIVGLALDEIVSIWFVDPVITFKDDWMYFYGAMMYRLITTWEQ